MLSFQEKETYEYYDIIYSGIADCPLETEYYLPDYCPDIFKVLSCQVLPRMGSYSLSEGKINCDGYVDIYISYIDENAAVIRSCELSKDFSICKDIGLNDSNLFFTACPVISNTVCRAVGSRKLSIQTRLDVKCDIYSHNRSVLMVPEPDMEIVRTDIEAEEASSEFCHEFSVSAVMELPEACPPIESIIRRQLCFRDIKTEFSDETIRLQGNIDLKIIYRPYSEKKILESVSYMIPFSEQIDSVKADEARAIVRCISGDLMTQKKEDNMGEYNSLEIFIKVFANIFLVKKRMLSLVSDMYSTEYNCKIGNADKCFCTYPDLNISETFTERSIQIPDIETVLDIWIENAACSTFTQNGSLAFRGKYSIALIYTDTAKRISCAKKEFDYSLVSNSVASQRRRMTCDPILSVSDYHISEQGSISVSVDLNVRCNCIDPEIMQLPQIQERGEKLNRNGNIIVYYPDGKEDLWSVCKKYHVSESKVISENKDLNRSALNSPLIIY